ncbi:hypothetical protein, partial [Microbulbifer taiwanensis]
IDTPRKAVASAAPEISSTINKTMYFFMSSNAAIRRGLLCEFFARKWERSDRAKSAQSKPSAALHCYAQHR